MQCGPIFHPFTGTATAKRQMPSTWPSETRSVKRGFFRQSMAWQLPGLRAQITQITQVWAFRPWDDYGRMVPHSDVLRVTWNIPVATSPYYSRPYSILMDFWTTNQRGAGAASESLSAKRESCTSSKQRHTLPSEREKGYGKSPFLMGKLTISMAIFNSYVKLPEGRPDDEYTTGLPAHVDQMMSLLLGNCASHVECQEL